jgi:hypothetical protein
MPPLPADTRPRPPIRAELPLFGATPVEAAPSAFAEGAVPPAAMPQAIRAWRSDGVGAAAGSFGDVEPPRLLTALNDPDMLPPEAGEPDDPQAIADLLLDRARDGARLARVFAHPSYSAFDGRDGETWARAVAENLAGIPIADPVAFYAEGRPAIASALFVEGRVPLAALSEHAVTAALCAGGWDGGRYGDVGCGTAGLARCDGIIAASDTPALTGPFATWDAALWDRIGAGACLFWSGATAGAGRVAVVIRKLGDADRRAIQVWGTVGGGEGSTEPEVLGEGDVWTRIPERIDTGMETFHFAGIGLHGPLGDVRSDLRPRGRCRLILRRRADGEIVYRSAWISMTAEGLSIARLLASLRSSPHAKEIEAAWRVRSLCLTPTAEVPDGAFLLDCAAGKWGRVAVRLDPLAGGPGADEPGAILAGGGKAAF